MADRGLLYVTMQPASGLSLDEFNDWYNNEHGPTRLKLPQMFGNGLRYRATDNLEPAYLAAYDVKSLAHLTTKTYTSLREHRSPREAATISQVAVTRHIQELISERSASGFVPPDQLRDEEADGQVLFSAAFTLKADIGAEKALGDWYNEEHVDMITKIPGWLRTRRFKTAAIDATKPPVFLALHEFAKRNGLGGPEQQAAIATPRSKDILENVVATSTFRSYSLFYAFGAAPRDLDSLSRLDKSKGFTSADSRTSTVSGSSPYLQSYVTASDGLEIPYQLEGNSSPTAPTIAFCNSLLTSLHMWDAVVELFKRERPEFRLLRYDARGRREIPEPSTPATLTMLSGDIVALLQALRISKLHALVGCSMGGATTLKFALQYPDKLTRFVACDFNIASSEAGTQAWKERIKVAEGSGASQMSGIEQLAGATVERWFHPNTLQNKLDTVKSITNMVAGNDVQGFKYSCQALWDYNMQDDAKHCRVPGLLIVGEDDAKGALVKAMQGFKDDVGKDGLKLAIIPEAGHQPMFENPRAFWNAVKEFI